MRLRELIAVSVKPKINERFSNVLSSELTYEESIVENLGTIDNISEIQLISGLTLIIEYADMSGVRTQRLVSCKQYILINDLAHLGAYCHHRKNYRTFRIDRIVDVFDAETGVSLSPVGTFFSKYSPGQFYKNGLPWELSTKRQNDLVALVNALIFIARCDRDYHPTEMMCLEQAITNFWLRLEIQGNADFDEILRYSDKLAPDDTTFWAALDRIRKDGTLTKIFRRHAHLLIQADGVVRPEETHWIVEIDDFLNEA